MCLVTEPRLENLVVCFKVCEEDLKHLLRLPEAEKFGRNSRNFYVLRPRGNGGQSRRRRVNRRRKRNGSGGISFTVFPKGGSVIATGIGGEEEVRPCLETFAASAGLSSNSTRWERRVVNSTYVGEVQCSAGDFSTYRVLYGQRERIESEREISVSFRTQFFPGILIKFRGQAGSVNLFNNGRYVIVGTSDREQTLSLHQRLCVLMRDYSTTLSPETRCAWTAAT